MGKAKEAIGELTDNQDLKARGQADPAAADAGRAGEEAKDAACDAFGRLPRDAVETGRPRRSGFYGPTPTSNHHRERSWVRRPGAKPWPLSPRS